MAELTSRTMWEAIVGLSGNVYGRVTRSLDTFGGVTAMTFEAAKHLVVDLATGEFAWKEFFAQAWFITSVTLVPTLLVAIPFGVTISI